MLDQRWEVGFTASCQVYRVRAVEEVRNKRVFAHASILRGASQHECFLVVMVLTRPLTAVSYNMSMLLSRKALASAAYFLKPAPGNHEGR